MPVQVTEFGADGRGVPGPLYPCRFNAAVALIEQAVRDKEVTPEQLQWLKEPHLRTLQNLLHGRGPVAKEEKKEGAK